MHQEHEGSITHPTVLFVVDKFGEDWDGWRTYLLQSGSDKSLHQGSVVVEQSYKGWNCWLTCMHQEHEGSVTHPTVLFVVDKFGEDWDGWRTYLLQPCCCGSLHQRNVVVEQSYKGWNRWLTDMHEESKGTFTHPTVSFVSDQFDEGWDGWRTYLLQSSSGGSLHRRIMVVEQSHKGRCVSKMPQRIGCLCAELGGRVLRLCLPVAQGLPLKLQFFWIWCSGRAALFTIRGCLLRLATYDQGKQDASQNDMC